jgi:dephospho-CoA kinase
VKKLKKKVKIIGLTGGAGSGKTEAAHFFSDLGFEVISLDDLGKEIFSSDKDIPKQIAEMFGPAVLNDEGKVVKAKLRKVVFCNKEAMEKLDSIYYSHFDTIISKKIDDFRKENFENDKKLVIDGAILHHAGLDKYTDLTVLIKTDTSNQLKRLNKRMKINEEQILSLLELQKNKLPADLDVDFFIKNNGTLEELRENIKNISEKISKK